MSGFELNDQRIYQVDPFSMSRANENCPPYGGAENWTISVLAMAYAIPQTVSYRPVEDPRTPHNLLAHQPMI